MRDTSSVTAELRKVSVLSQSNVPQANDPPEECGVFMFEGPFMKWLNKIMNYLLID